MMYNTLQEVSFLRFTSNKMSNVFSINLNDEEVTDEHYEQGNIRDVQFGFSQIDVTVRGATFSFSPSETVCIEEVISCQTQAKYSRKIMQNYVKEMNDNYWRYACERLQLPVPGLLWIGVANLSLELQYIPLTPHSKYCLMSARHWELEIEREMENQGGSSDISPFLRLAVASDLLERIYSNVRQCELKNIFDTVQGNRPKTILVDFKPTFGKTTLVDKIIRDWVLEKEYFWQFEFEIFTILEELNGQLLRVAVVEKLGLEEFDDESVWSMVNGAKTFFLLDVFDEIRDSAMRNFRKLLSDANKNRMTITTMRRTEYFKLRYEEMETVFKGRAISDAIWDREVNILRLISENLQLVLEIFLEGNLDESTLLERINQVIAPLEILRVFVTRENSEHKSRRTDLLKNLVDCVVGQSTGENW